MPGLLSLNVARHAVHESFVDKPTAIGKRPVDGPIEVREPGSKRDGLGSGLVGDVIGDHRHHGGTNQAVYAVAREVLEDWERRLDRPLPNGTFGENLTTVGLDVDGALVGERWRIGADVVVQVTVPRIPCATFRGRMGVPGWLKLFTADARPGAYLRIVDGGAIRRGDPIEVVHRPEHDVTVSMMFRALMGERPLLPRLLAAGDDLVDDVREYAEQGRPFTVDV